MWNCTKCQSFGTGARCGCRNIETTPGYTVHTLGTILSFFNQSRQRGASGVVDSTGCETEEKKKKRKKEEEEEA